MPSDEQIISTLYKNKLNKAYGNFANQYFSETYPYYQKVLNGQIWLESDQIPTNAPVLANEGSDGIVQYFVKLQLSIATGYDDVFYHDNMRNIIPSGFNGDINYNWKVYPQASDIEIDKGTYGISIDESGVLVFYEGLPPGVNLAAPPRVTFYRYVGKFGAGSSEIAESEFAVYQDATPANRMVMNISAISGDSTRTITVPNQDVDLTHASNMNQDVSTTGTPSFTEISLTANANNIALTAPAGLVAGYGLALPPDAGSIGQVLATNGSDTLSWVNNTVTADFDATEFRISDHDTPAIKISFSTTNMTSSRSVTMPDVNVDLTHAAAMNQGVATTDSTTFANVTATGGLKLKETGGGEDIITIQAPATSNAYSLTLPSDNGAPNQVPMTDGSGFLSWANATNLVPEKNTTGFEQWSNEVAPFWSITDIDKFNLLKAGSGYIKSVLVNWTQPQQITLVANTSSLIYINSSGTLTQVDYSAITESTYVDNIPLFSAIYDGSIITVKKENNSFKRNLLLSRYIKQNIGSTIRGDGAIAERVTTGTGGVVTDRQIKIVGADYLDGTDLITAIPEINPAIINFWYVNASSNWIRYANQADFPMYFASGGTISALNVNNYGIFRLYAAHSNLNETTPTYIAIIHTAQFSDLNSVITTIKDDLSAIPTNELAIFELCQLGHIVVHNSGDGYIKQIFIQNTKFNSSRFSHLFAADLDGGQYADGGHSSLTIKVEKTADPTANDDVSNYKTGTLWINTSVSPNTIWICEDNSSSAAVWKKLAINADAASFQTVETTTITDPADSGINVDGVVMHDGILETDEIDEKTAGAGVNVGGIVFSGGRIGADIIIGGDIGVAGDSNLGIVKLKDTVEGKYILTTQDNATIYTTSDYGANWSVGSSYVARGAACSFNGQYQIFAIEDGSIQRSVDYGATFNSITTTAKWKKITSSQNGQYVLAYANLNGKGSLYVSQNYGQTFILNTNISGDIGDIEISGDGQYALLVFNGGALYVSSDYGVNWAVPSTPPPDGVICLSIDSDGSNMLCAIYGGTLYVSTNYGDVWAAPSGFGTTANWLSTTIDSAGTKAIAGTSNNKAYYTSDLQNWALADGGATNRYWLDVTISGDGTFVATATYNSPYVYYSSFANVANAWTAASTQLPATRFSHIESNTDGTLFVGITDTDVYTSSDCDTWTNVHIAANNWNSIKLGTYLYGSQEDNKLYKSSDNGVNWIDLSLANKKWKEIQCSYSGQNQIACVKDATINDTIYYSSDYGETWYASGNIGLWETLAISGDGQYCQVASDSTTYYSSNGGATWTEATTTLANVNSIAINYVGDFRYATISGGNIYISSNGDTWTSKATARTWSSCSSSKLGKFAIACVDGGRIYFTENYGENWKEQGVVDSWKQIKCSASASFIVTSDGTDIYISTNYGATFTAQGQSLTAFNAICLSSGLPSEISCIEGKFNIAGETRFDAEVDIDDVININSTMYLNGEIAGKIEEEGKYVYLLQYANSLQKSDDYGVNFTSISGPTTFWRGAISNDGKYVSLTRGNTTGLYVSNNYGETYTLKENTVISGSIAVSSSGKYQFISVSGGAGFYISADYGETWESIEYLADKTIQDIIVSYTGTFVYVITTSGDVYDSANYGVTWDLYTPPIGFYGMPLCFSGDRKYQFLRNNNENIYLSNDYGVNWSNTGISGVLSDVTEHTRNYSMSFDGKYQFIINTSLELYGSSDYGVTWSKYKDALDGDSAQVMVKCTASGKYIVLEAWIDASQIIQQYLSDDYGQTWIDFYKAPAIFDILISAGTLTSVHCNSDNGIQLSVSDANKVLVDNDGTTVRGPLVINDVLQMNGTLNVVGGANLLGDNYAEKIKVDKIYSEEGEGGRYMYATLHQGYISSNYGILFTASTSLPNNSIVREPNSSFDGKYWMYAGSYNGTGTNINNEVRYSVNYGSTISVDSSFPDAEMYCTTMSGSGKYRYILMASGVLYQSYTPDYAYGTPNWTSIATGIPAIKILRANYSGSVLIGASTDGIYVSFNSGVAFVKVLDETGIISMKINVTGGTIAYVKENENVYISEDFGQTWEVKTVSGGITAKHVCFSEKMDYLYVRDILGFYYSTDKGDNWSYNTGCGASSTMLFSNTECSGTGKWLITADSTNKNFISSDYGITWTEAGGSFLAANYAYSYLNRGTFSEINFQTGEISLFGGACAIKMNKDTSVDIVSSRVDMAGVLYVNEINATGTATSLNIEGTRFKNNTISAFMTISGSISAGDLVKLNSSGIAAKMTTSDSHNSLIGVSLDTETDGNDINVVIEGSITATADGAVTVGHYISPSATTDGYVSDAGTTFNVGAFAIATSSATSSGDPVTIRLIKIQGSDIFSTINTGTLELDDGSANKWSLTSASLASDKTLVLPDDNGTASQYLASTDAAGTMAWRSPNNIVVHSDSGAATVTFMNETHMITKSDGAAAITLADPAAAQNGIIVHFMSTTSQAHTIDNSAGSGFNGDGASADVATFGGTNGDTLTLVAYNQIWWVLSYIGVSFA